jgi:hypothetical protein
MMTIRNDEGRGKDFHFGTAAMRAGIDGPVEAICPI